MFPWKGFELEHQADMSSWTEINQEQFLVTPDFGHFESGTYSRKESDIRKNHYSPEMNIQPKLAADNSPPYPSLYFQYSYDTFLLSRSNLDDTTNSVSRWFQHKGKICNSWKEWCVEKSSHGHGPAFPEDKTESHNTTHTEMQNRKCETTWCLP